MKAVYQKSHIKLISPSHVLQDITSLLHTIYEVVDASVNHSPSSSKTLRVKLSVAPDSSQRWRSCTQGAAGKACINTVGGGRGEERAFSGPPLKLPAVSSPRDVFVVMQKGVCFRPVRALFLVVSVSLHLSHSMGFIFNDGGVTELREPPPPLPPSVPSNTLKETLRDVPSPFDNHSHFSFLQSSLFSPSSPRSLTPPISELLGKYSCVQLNFSH